MINYSRFTLDNGLRVVHNLDDSTAMVAVNILYNVGSRDESPEMTGLAHLFEHLMFAGSANIPDFDAEMERAGGINNAWTSNDFTNFYDVAPAQNVETLLWLESDRMLGLAFSDKELEVQRRVVIEEFKQTCLNRPYGDLSHKLRSLIYREHPYRYPTIGKEVAHIEKVTEQDVRDFFYRHYAPNNAVLAISGNISLERTKELVQKWFGDIPRRDIPARKYLPEPPVTSPRRLEVTGNVPQAMVVIAFPMPGYGEDGYVECDLITDLLASGKSSRFYRNLVMGTAPIASDLAQPASLEAQESVSSESIAGQNSTSPAGKPLRACDIFADADASIMGSEEPGFLMLKARLTDSSDSTIALAERLLLDQALRLTLPIDNVSQLTMDNGQLTIPSGTPCRDVACHVRKPDGTPTGTPTGTPDDHKFSAEQSDFVDESIVNCPLSIDTCVTNYELQRAINRFASDTTFSSVNYLSRAQALAMAEMHGEDINSIVPYYRTMTPERLAATARRIIDPTRACTLIYRPGSIDN